MVRSLDSARRGERLSRGVPRADLKICLPSSCQMMDLWRGEDERGREGGREGGMGEREGRGRNGREGGEREGGRNGRKEKVGEKIKLRKR